MNIKNRYLAAIAVGILLAANTVAAAGNLASIVGAGTASCGEVLSSSIEISYFIWAQGHLSAMNLFLTTVEETNLSDHDGQQIWLKNYCEENPLEKYVQAVWSLWIELRITQGLEPDPRFNLKD